MLICVSLTANIFFSFDQSGMGGNHSNNKIFNCMYLGSNFKRLNYMLKKFKIYFEIFTIRTNYDFRFEEKKLYIFSYSLFVTILTKFLYFPSNSKLTHVLYHFCSQAIKHRNCFINRRFTCLCIKRFLLV